MIKSHVLGSELLATMDDYERRLHSAGHACILSLDFRDDCFLGPPELLEDAALWPRRVIVMTLARVGTGLGPDLERLGRIMARAGGRKVYSAGGVRRREDLLALRDAGAAGVLVASALHGGTIEADDLEEIAGS
jgi:phosphoribosylformimino-5-aminoimidazole carboxamide ribotide isomerase